MSPSASDGVIRQLRAAALVPQPDAGTTVLPDWAAPAVRPPSCPPWPETRRWFAVEVHDEAGTVGAFGPCAGAVVEIIRDQIAPVLLGRPVDAWRGLGRLPVVGRHRSGAHFRLAVSAVELALWDLRSRRARRPVVDLLGGRCRGATVAYATAFGIDVDHPLAPDIARWIAASGFWGQKWRLPGVDRDESPRSDAQRVGRLRDAIGPDARLMIDGLGRWSGAYLERLLPALAAAEVTWVEEPASGSQRSWAGMGMGVPLAADEHAYDQDEQTELIMSGRVQVWQPDVAWHGGLAQALAMVDLATSRGIPSFPHASSLPAALHLAALCDAVAVPAVEYHLTLDPRRQSVLEQPPKPSNGVFTLPEEPGLTGAYRLAGNDRLMLAGGGACAS